MELLACMLLSEKGVVSFMMASGRDFDRVLDLKVQIGIHRCLCSPCSCLKIEGEFVWQSSILHTCKFKHKCQCKLDVAETHVHRIKVCFSDFGISENNLKAAQTLLLMTLQVRHQI